MTDTEKLDVELRNWGIMPETAEYERRMAALKQKHEWKLVEKNKLVLEGTDYWVCFDENRKEFVTYKGDREVWASYGLLVAKSRGEDLHRYDLEAPQRRKNDLKELGLD